MGVGIGRDGAANPMSRIPAGIRTAAWICGVFGAVALFMGFFITFAGENQSVGLGGDLSWQVGEIGTAWVIGLIAGGAVLLAVALGLVLGHRRPR